MAARDAAEALALDLQSTLLVLAAQEQLLDEVIATLAALSRGQRTTSGAYLALRRRAMVVQRSIPVARAQIQSWAHHAAGAATLIHRETEDTT